MDRGPGASRTPTTTSASAPTASRSSTPRPDASSTRAATPRSTPSGRRRPRPSRRTGPSASRSASRGRCSPVQVVLKKRDRRNLFRELCSTLVDPASPDVNPAPPPKLGRSGRSSRTARRGQGRPPRPRRRLHRGQGLAKFRADAKRMVDTLFRYEPFKEPQGRLQRPRARPPVGRERRRTALSRSSTAARPCGSQYDAFGSERYVLDLRQPRAARRGGRGALRRHGDRRQRRAVRRRRHLQPLRDAPRPTRASPTTSSCTSSATTSPAWPTSTTRPTSPTDRRRRAPGALGAERHGPAGSRDAQVEGPRRGRNAAPDPVGEGGLREDLPRLPGATQGSPRRRSTADRHRRPLPRAEEGMTKTASDLRAFGNGNDATFLCGKCPGHSSL